jgi:hypothetical protein
VKLLPLRPLIVLPLVLLGAGSVHGKPRNVVFILSDDHRYDYMGFHPGSPDFLETPAMDRMAAGTHLANAMREERYKYIDDHGVWDRGELYDLKLDPEERYNLIAVPAEQERVRRMRETMCDIFEASGATDVKFRRPGNFQMGERKRS